MSEVSCAPPKEGKFVPTPGIGLCGKSVRTPLKTKRQIIFVNSTVDFNKTLTHGFNFQCLFFQLGGRSIGFEQKNDITLRKYSRSNVRVSIKAKVSKFHLKDAR